MQEGTDPPARRRGRWGVVIVEPLAVVRAGLAALIGLQDDREFGEIETADEHQRTRTELDGIRLGMRESESGSGAAEVAPCGRLIAPPRRPPGGWDASDGSA